MNASVLARVLLALFAFAVCGSSSAQPVRSADAYQKGVASYAVTVDAGGNVFASGVGGLKANGGGKKPAIVRLNEMRSGVVWFPSVLGRVSCCSGGTTFNGPEGGTNASGSTDIQSSGGISGIIDHDRTMFLVGVFAGYPGPGAPGPARRDVTYDSGKLDVYPKLNQTFYIGNGKLLKGGAAYRRFHVPQGANRLVLGFADAYSFHGAPGAYDDNVGHLDVRAKASPQY